MSSPQAVPRGGLLASVARSGIHGPPAEGRRQVAHSRGDRAVPRSSQSHRDERVVGQGCNRHTITPFPEVVLHKITRLWCTLPIEQNPRAPQESPTMRTVRNIAAAVAPPPSPGKNEIPPCTPVNASHYI